MTSIYLIEECFPPTSRYTMTLETPLVCNFWGTEFIARGQFEDASHRLVALDDDYRRGASDQSSDICKADTAFWTIPDTAWDWLADLEADGCRIAHAVRVEKGKRQFKLVHAAPIMDLLDVETSDTTITDDILANVAWNGDTISWVRQHYFYAWDGPVPLMFQVLYHNRDGAMYRGSAFGLSGRTFVSSAFKDEYERRKLTGLQFHEIRRTTPSPHSNPRVK